MSGRARAALALLIFLAVGAAVVPAFAPADPLSIDAMVAARLVPPGHTDAAGHFHLLGTDRFGRDLFTRMMLAARVSLLVGVVGSLLAAAAGTLIGAVAAWSGRWVDAVLMAVADALLSIPRLILLLVCVALWHPGAGVVIAVLVATGWMGVSRLVRAEVLGIRRLSYVDAATALGATPLRTLFRHVVPNALGPTIVAGTLGVGNAILLESGLSYLGLGIQPPRPSWGNMIASGKDLIVTAPWVAITPGVALILTVLACTLLGDWLGDVLAGESAMTLRERA